MPLQTHNIAKGIAPKIHLPKSTKSKPSTVKKGGTAKLVQAHTSHKQVASKSKEGSEVSSNSEDSEPKPKKKKAKQTQEETVSKEEVDVSDARPPVDDAEEEEDVEQQSDKDEVSTNGSMISRVHIDSQWE